jgi:hypothetical protein
MFVAIREADGEKFTAPAVLESLYRDIDDLKAGAGELYIFSDAKVLSFDARDDLVENTESSLSMNRKLTSRMSIG